MISWLLKISTWLEHFSLVLIDNRMDQNSTDVCIFYASRSELLVYVE